MGVCVLSICRSVRAVMLSTTLPRSDASRCTSSRISSFTFSASAFSPFLRVITSHFSGVVTITCVSAISCRVSCMSPVSSRTSSPSRSSRFLNFSTISCASAFMGAT